MCAVRLVLVTPLLALAVFAACGDGPDPPAPTPEPTLAGPPEPVSGLPVLGPATQDLQLFGIVEGTMTQANASCAHFRGATPEKGRLQIALQGLIGGASHTLRFIVNGYTGPGSYSWDGPEDPRPEVTVTLDDKEMGHATISVDESGGSGDIEGILTSPNQGRVAGLWECPGIPR